MNNYLYTKELKDILVDNKLTRYVGRQREGRLDTKRLYRAAFTNRVFKKKEALGGKEYNILLMVDCSGSMTNMKLGYRYNIVKNTLPKFLDEFYSMANVYIQGFNSVGHEFLRPGEKLDTKALTTALYEQCKQENAVKSSGGTAYGNHDGYLIAEAYKKTLRNLKGQKVVIVITDGRPHCDEGPNCGKPGCGTNEKQGQYLRETISGLKKEGVEVIGLGMGTNSVKEFYPRYEVINNTEELFKATIKNLRAIVHKPIAR